ncbi:MAG: ribonuclease Y [Candidatus Omnitrophica bacterium]|nr:ribonuclease Y [Candidatus Omnitrophota bacterium]
MDDFSLIRFWAIQVVVVVVIFGLGYFSRRFIGERKIKQAESVIKEMLDSARRQAEVIQRDSQLQAKELMYQNRLLAEEEAGRRRQELASIEKQFTQREKELDSKADLIRAKETMISNHENSLKIREEQVGKKEKELESLIVEEKDRLSIMAGMTQEEAKKVLLSRLEQEVHSEANLLVKRLEEEALQEADRRGKNIIALAIQRCAAEQTAESTVTVVPISGDDMKGRIIGKEGRNIRALEMATGVDFIIDDSPDTVTVSGFDPFRREIAKRSLERLMQDGRIHPSRIEEVVEKVKRDMDLLIREEGEKIVAELGIQGGLHPELIRLIGRLKFRTSYGQNVLLHAKETTHFMGVMAAELGLDYHLARRIGLLHDIGKAVSHEVEGTHALIGAELAKKHGESSLVVNAIAAHHEEMEPSSIYATLIIGADAISASRPGARGDTLENYIKRLQKLEAIADQHPGVAKAYAISAGREIRVIVNPEKINDENTYLLARELKQKIQEGLEFPGQIKVTVIRETRAVEFAG